MDSIEAPVPSDREVLKQLERIVASSKFKGSATQAHLLRFVVEQGLAKNPIKEIYIGYAIFENYNPDSNKVRSNASIVRQKLDEYYEDEGKNEPIRINLPPGANYKPDYTYHWSAEALRLYERALSCQAIGTSDALLSAKRLFIKVLGLIDDFIPACVGLMATSLELEIVMYLLPRIGFTDDTTDETWARVDWLKQRDPRCWFLCIFVGVDQLMKGYWKQAGEHFAEAMSIDPKRTLTSSWYATYLVAIGRSDDGLNIASAAARAAPANSGTALVHAFLLYLTRDYVLAEQVLNAVYAFDERETIRTLIGQLINLEVGKNKLVIFHFRKIGELMSPKFPEVSFVDSLDVTLCREYCGLPILAFVRLFGADVVKGQIVSMGRKWKYIQHAQRALMHMSLGRETRAVNHLEQAVRSDDVAIYWLHLLPIFDPLRKQPRFQKLLKQLAERGRMSEGM